jgi:hypothetical protein
MPIYQYRCKTCGTDAEVIRSLADSEVVPTAAEEDPTTRYHGHQDACADGHAWEKLLGVVKTIKGRSWGRGKGHWLLPLALALGSLLGCDALQDRPPSKHMIDAYVTQGQEWWSIHVYTICIRGFVYYIYDRGIAPAWVHVRGIGYSPERCEVPK